MHLTLTRYCSTQFDTLGRLFIDNRFACYTLEDEYQPAKIAGETRIPAGTYRLALRESPRFSPKYGHEMIWLKDVPGFEFVLIHCGNTKDDTAGCILIGDCAHVTPGGRSSLSESRKAYNKIYPIIAEAIREGEVEIEVRDK
jgi:hypothetical protein